MIELNSFCHSRCVNYRIEGVLEGWWTVDGPQFVGLACTLHNKLALVEDV